MKLKIEQKSIYLVENAPNSYQIYSFSRYLWTFLLKSLTIEISDIYIWRFVDSREIVLSKVKVIPVKVSFSKLRLISFMYMHVYLLW